MSGTVDKLWDYVTSPSPWRVGRSVGRTVYDCDGRLIGVMDTPELAARVVAAINAPNVGPPPSVVHQRRRAPLEGVDVEILCSPGEGGAALWPQEVKLNGVNIGPVTRIQVDPGGVSDIAKVAVEFLPASVAVKALPAAEPKDAA